MEPSSSNAWLGAHSSDVRARLRLVCFPHAGGDAGVFRAWPSLMPDGVEVLSVRLPGRERRIREPLVRSVEELASLAAVAIAAVCGPPVALFGHSMGALVAFEAARLLAREHDLLPAHLFVSGHRGPDVVRDRDFPNLASDDALRDELEHLDGTPAEVLEHPELMELFIPILRADLEACASYRYVAGEPLACDVSAYGGLEDPEVSRESLAAWQRQTSERFTVRMFRGGHFFPSDSKSGFVESFAEDLASVLARLH